MSTVGGVYLTVIVPAAPALFSSSTLLTAAGVPASDNSESRG